MNVIDLVVYRNSMRKDENIIICWIPIQWAPCSLSTNVTENRSEALMHLLHIKPLLLTVFASYSSYASSACTVSIRGDDPSPMFDVNITKRVSEGFIMSKLTIHSDLTATSQYRFVGASNGSEVVLSEAETRDLLASVVLDPPSCESSQGSCPDTPAFSTMRGNESTLSVPRHTALSRNKMSIQYRLIGKSFSATRPMTFPSGHRLCSLPVNGSGEIHGFLQANATTSNENTFSATLTSTMGATVGLVWKDLNGGWRNRAPNGGGAATLTIHRSISLDVQPKSIHYGKIPANVYHSRDFSVSTDGVALNVPAALAELSFNKAGFPANVQVDVLRNGVVVNNVSVPLTSDNVFQVRIKSDTAIGYASGVINVNATLL